MLPLLILLLTSLITAHVEEQCFFPNNLMNLYQTAELLNCKYGEYTPKCIISTLVGGSQTFGETSPCRGFVHFDSVFFTAQAVGFTGEIAYWIAAYAQAVDFVQFVQVDSCGNALDMKYWTPPMRGFLRTSTFTGQHLRHLGLVYRGVNATSSTNGVTGLSPNLNDLQNEGLLVTARNWAFNNTDLYCTCGMTEPSNGNYFNGSQCINSTNFIDNASPTAIVGPIPTPAINTTLGDQIMHYDCIGDEECANPPYNLTNVWYAYELDDYLANQTNFSRLANGKPVPGVIARLGNYMHQLADRASHYYCTDQADTAILGPRTSDGAFYLSWNVTMCNFPFHGTEHYWEQGVEPILAPQSWTALSYYYDELLAFKNKFRPLHPEWFTAVDNPISKSVVVGNVSKPGLLANLTMIPNVVQRVVLFMKAINDFGFQQVPGQSTPCNQWFGLDDVYTTFTFQSTSQPQTQSTTVAQPTTGQGVSSQATTQASQATLASQSTQSPTQATSQAQGTTQATTQPSPSCPAATTQKCSCPQVTSDANLPQTHIYILLMIILIFINL